MKRFTDTEKWRDPWFRRLSPPAKFLWLYLTDHCDRTGLVDPDFEAISFHVGLNITEKHLSELGDRVQRTVEGKIFISRFITFQYGELSETCPAHKPVLRLVAERNLSRNGKGYQYPNATLPLPLPKGRRTVQEKEEEKNKEEGEGVQGGEKPALCPKPEDIYNAYPRKAAKPVALIAITKAIKGGFGAPFLLERTLAYSKARASQNPGLTPHPATWFNRHQFNDDPETWKDREPFFRPEKQEEKLKWIN